MGFTLREVFARISKFPIDIILTEFAEQRITRHTEVSLETAQLCILG